MSETASLPIAVPSRPPLGERLLSDERLARLVARGAERAFTAIYQRHHQALYRYCRSILGQDQDAQDALQSTMLHAYRALCARERDLAVRPWLFRIAHNEAISILRRRGPAPASLDGTEEALQEGVEHALSRRERLATVVRDLHALPERQRAALLMRELSGLSIAEIAAALGISPGAAKQAVFEARCALHELAEGRTMECEDVRRAISRRDGRVLRGRRIGSHLRSCPDCRAFRAAIATRRGDLRALAPPLPAAASATLLARLFAHGGGPGGGIAAGGSGTALGGHLAAPALLKGAAGMTVLALATTGALRTIEHAGHARPRPPGVHAASAAQRRTAIASRPGPPPAGARRHALLAGASGLRRSARGTPRPAAPGRVGGTGPTRGQSGVAATVPTAAQAQPARSNGASGGHGSAASGGHARQGTSTTSRHGGAARAGKTAGGSRAAARGERRGGTRSPGTSRSGHGHSSPASAGAGGNGRSTHTPPASSPRPPAGDTSSHGAGSAHGHPAPEPSSSAAASGADAARAAHGHAASPSAE